MHYDNCDYPVQPLLLKPLSSQIFLVLNILAAFDTFFFKPPTAHLVLKVSSAKFQIVNDILTKRYHLSLAPLSFKKGKSHI